MAARRLAAAWRGSSAVGAAPSGVRCSASAAQMAEKATVTSVDPSVAKAKYGFEEVRQEYISEYGSLCTLYRHTVTGAELISVQNDDENKTFGAVFRTPPENSTGIPHILEHSVLCGSRRYPIKEPFVELMKSSLNTFLNAFTYPDRTCYPVASCNLRDFYNLVDVYLDAVFYPRCVESNNPEGGRQIFEQEGWHYELESSEKKDLSFKGVVFNEMKGVYSSPDSVLGRVCQQQLFPDTTYGVDSGGSPEYITDLSYDEFKDFHSAFYHPSNTRFWFYGNDDPEKRLEILNGYLVDFEANQEAVAKSKVLTQSLFTEPKTVVDYYAVSDGPEEKSKAFVSVNWLLSEDVFDVETQLAFGFLDFLLLGTSGSPLRKALIDSGLGEAICGGGLEDELRQPTFSIGLKGVQKENLVQVEAIVMDTLKQLSKTGFTQSAVEAALNTIEFSLRENNTGSFPRGLSLMIRSMAQWIYDKDPFEPLKWEEELSKFKSKLEADGDNGKKIFGGLIDRYLVANAHRVTVQLLPDPSLSEKMEAQEQEKLDRMRADMGPAEVDDMIAKTKALKLHQETPDPAEALKCIPTLALKDIPKQGATIPSAVSSLGEGEGVVEVLRHDIFTNNVVYAEVAFDMSAIPAPLLYLVPLFCRCLTNMGTDEEDFVQLTERIGRKTGGLSAYPFTTEVKGSSVPKAYIVVRGKATGDKFGDFLDIANDVLVNTNFDNKERFRQMVLETKAGQESAIVGRGHTYANGRLNAQRSTAGALSERLGGVANMEAVKALTARVESDWPSVKADLESIRDLIFKKKGTIVNLTADDATLKSIDGYLTRFVESLPEGAPQVQDWALGQDASLLLPKSNELLVVPTQVNYVAKATNLYEDAGYELDGTSQVISKYLGATWLWDRVRVSGGAYGGFCNFDIHSGMFSFMSYRDPNLTKTVANYDGSAGYLAGLKMDEDELNKAIIACIGDIDSYQLPDAKGYTSFVRHIMGISDEDRQRRREQILGTTLDDFHRFAKTLETAMAASSQVCAVTSKEMGATAQEERKDLGFVTKNVL